MTEGVSIERALLNTDGGSRGNPGISGIGFTLSVDDGRGLETLCRGGAYIGQATNNVAEYRALIWGLANAAALNVRHLEVHADSELLVKQINGEYRVKNEGIKPLYSEAKQLLAGFASWRVKHVLRAYNSVADALANEAMDCKGSVGDIPVEYVEGTLFSSLTSPQFSPQPKPTKPTKPAKPSLETQRGLQLTEDSMTSSFPQATSDQEVFESRPATGTTTRSATGMATKTTTGTGIYTLTIKEHFDAAHALVGYPGQCRNLHGHTWDVEVSVRGIELDEVGIVYDFKDIKRDLAAIISDYDHVYLNDVAPFDELNATAENLARVIYEQMELLLPEGIELVEVSVWESPIAKLTYTRE